MTYVVTALTNPPDRRAHTVTIDELTAEALTDAAVKLGFPLINPADVTRRLLAALPADRRAEGRVLTDDGMLIVRKVDTDADLIERFRVPSGWMGLLLELHAAMTTLDSDAQIADVKAHGAELHVSLVRNAAARRPEIHELLREATRRSRDICEHCGGAGTVYRSRWGWRSRLCANCAAASPLGYVPAPEQD